jgi:hypothetical protein
MPKKSTQNRKQAQPLLTALQKLKVDPAVKTPALEFLTSDFSVLRSKEEFAKAFAGLGRCQTLLGPLNINYCRTLEAHRRLLVTFAKLATEWQQIWFQGDVAHAWSSTLPLLEAHLPPPIWEKIKTNLNGLFEGDPPL